MSRPQSLGFRIFRRLALAVQSHFAGFDRRASSRPAGLVARTVDDQWPPVFILGAPRSGTTMLYQVLLSSTDLAFISNLLAAFPALIPRLCRAWPSLAGPYPPQVREAEYGFTPGLRSPSEAGKIMDAWFGDRESGEHAAQVRATVAAISEARRAPLLIKSLTIGQNLPALRFIFPSARIIHIRRDSRYVAQSILTARRRMALTPEESWSVRAPGDPPFRLTTEEELAAWQAVNVDRFLTGELAHDKTVVRVGYEDACATPEAEVKRIADSLGLEVRPSLAGFEGAVFNRNRRSIDETSWQRLSEAVAAFSRDRDNHGHRSDPRPAA